MQSSRNQIGKTVRFGGFSRLKQPLNQGPINFGRSHPEVIQDQPQILTTTAQQGKHRITQLTLQRGTIESSIGLHVTDDRLNRTA